MFFDWEMTSHFRWYTNDAETVIPFQASYKFPTEASKSEKMTPRIPPKNGSVFQPGNVIRLEFPAQGYVNTRNTVIEFDLNFYCQAEGIYRLQNDVQSCFQRVRILYGGTPLEDIIDYNSVRRCMTEWTGTNQNGVIDQSSIHEGIGGQMVTTAGAVDFEGHVNVRNKYIQGYSGALRAGSLLPTTTVKDAANFNASTAGAVFTAGNTVLAPSLAGYAFKSTRRYCIQLGAGLMNQEKLLPTKWMASQFAIEITLANAADCIYSPTAVLAATTQTFTNAVDATYTISNVNLIPEILQFDPSYDEAFLVGLKSGGVPIKFASYHRYGYVTSGSNVNFSIQEKSRSVKSIFTVQKRNASGFGSDSGACLFDTADNGASTLQTYQYRVGGRYFPSAPVENANSGSAVSNGAAESYIELAKALGTLGDARLSTNMSVQTWGLQSAATTAPGTAQEISGFHERDYSTSLISFAASGVPTMQVREGNNAASAYGQFCGNIPSQMFAMAINLETTNGAEISGLNAEEQVHLN